LQLFSWNECSACTPDAWLGIEAAYRLQQAQEAEVEESQVAMTGARMIRGSCQGFVDRHEDGVYARDANEYGNTFSNEVALFAMSDGSACRVVELYEICFWHQNLKYIECRPSPA